MKIDVYPRRPCVHAALDRQRGVYNVGRRKDFYWITQPRSKPSVCLWSQPGLRLAVGGSRPGADFINILRA